jgi:hypothetical protein
VNISSVQEYTAILYHQLNAWHVFASSDQAKETNHVKIDQLSGVVKDMLGHVCEIHVILYDIPVTFPTASLIYHVHCSSPVRIFEAFPVRFVLSRLYGSVARPLISDHVNVRITFPLVHQFAKCHDGYETMMSHVGAALSILSTVVLHVHLFHALSCT